ncbi:dTDP-4-dehydrorhamnose reductase [Cupriavidus sp. RAF12]|uniref:dTDP-4-dehydrorhamnose reductase n=1 Tax=Cupriavidus sp. RAF12 TaxID=3233050 RepID=UPI003F8EBAD6
MPTILITGADGQLGFELRRSFAPLGEVIALDRKACDVTHIDAVRQVFVQYRPDVVLNAAAYTAVDQAESDVESAYAANALAPGILADVTRDAGGLLVHYSTDYVFDGRQAQPYTEADIPAPLSVYGRTKLEGERAVEAAGGQSLVLRTSWLAGAHGANFARTILALAGRERQLRVVADQIGTPTMAALVADVTAQIVSRYWLAGAQEAFPSGLYHLTAQGRASWHAYACEIVRVARARGAVLKARVEDIEAIASVPGTQRAQRPACAVLDTGKLQSTFDIHLPPWEQGVHWLLEQLLS